MLFVALGYRELNRAMPDSGSSFTWGSRALGPRLGWMAGWGLIVATIIVLSSLAQVAVTFFYEALDQVFGTDYFAELDKNVLINVLSVLAFVAAATWMVYRDVQFTAKFQYFMVAFQLLAIFIFGVVALVKYNNGTAFNSGPDRLALSWQWFNPFNIDSMGSFISGVTVAVFIFWGWDVVLTATEETKDSAHTPGRAAAVTIVLITVYYLFICTTCIAFAGVGTEGLGLNSPDIQGGFNVFAMLAGPVLGGAAILVSLAILSSSLASLESTFVGPARTMLAMGHYGALSPSFAKTSKFATPKWATITAGLVAGGFYAVVRPISENIISDTVSTTAILICFYYGLTSFAAVWYFRRQWFASFRNFWFQFFFPLAGGLFLAFMVVHEFIASTQADYGSGSSVGGIGLVFILTLVVLLVGVAIMIACQVRFPGFFRGQTIPQGTAEGNGQDPHFTVLTDAQIDRGGDFAPKQA
jgi:amino acid transporter